MIDFSNKASIERLVKSCVNGDRISQKELFQTFYGKMLGVCMRYTGNKTEAQDVVHDAFIKVFLSLSKFENKGSLEGWIRRIMVNSAIDHVRKKREMFLSGDESKIEALEDDVNEQFEIEIYTKIKADLVMKCVQQLSPAYRTVFNMYIVENYSHQEIAEILNISVGASKSNLAKAKMRVQELFKLHSHEIEE